MEMLPQEVFDQIARLIYDNGTAEDFRNANYLCAGFFRACWELREHEWHKITIRPRKLDTFVALCRSFGRPVLKEAAYVLELPEGFDVDPPRASGEPGAFDELVTDQIFRLFHALKTLDDEGFMWSGLRVDIQKPKKLEAAVDATPRLIHLVRPEELPVVKCMWYLSMGEWYDPYQGGDPYEFAPGTPKTDTSSAQRMPRLKSAMIWLPIHWAPSDRDDYYAVDDLDYMHHKMNGRDVGWGIGYRVPGTRERPELWKGRRVRGDVRQFWWSLAFDRLPGELRDEIREIGREHGGRLDDYECTFGDQNPLWFTMFVADEGNGVGYLS
ncbi:hypothetical protein CSOJ01_08309 [Colletotrichum sojae]|uniref:Uncharacterized protein n=1 Tax=Colletotrichum sojae TaxID=2175907 RepID=A0A8H6MT65_9PEZI|nr:hypothetical protein CSOJ01_08309 [Colletotrichum sojae]